jgi:prephenate dehydratase
LTGAVPNAYELLFSHNVRAIAETRVRIDHVLVAPPGVALEDVARVLSHPVALAQCRRFFAAHPDIEPVAVFDTAGAVEMVVREADGRSAALASRRSADLYGAAIVAEHFQDHAENWTRFLLVAPRADDADTETGRKALVTFGLPHVPGALLGALAPLAAAGLNLTRIQSQPVHGQPFEYRFIVELTASAGVDLQRVLANMRDVTLGLRVFGVYPHHGT